MPERTFELEDLIRRIKEEAASSDYPRTVRSLLRDAAAELERLAMEDSNRAAGFE